MADRISELPEPILHHILSFVSFKQVARTCVLSKKWEEAWHNYPVFIIDESITGDSNCPFDCQYCDMKIREAKKELFNCLEQTLRNRRCKDLISMEKFKIKTSILGGHEFASFVDRCVRYAIARNVKILKLTIVSECHKVFGYYDLPQIVLCTTSIEVLKLKRCKVELPIRSNVKLSSLRKLHMFEVLLDDHVLKNILAGCPLLEALSLVTWMGLDTLELFGHDKLNYIDIFCWGINRVDIKTKSISSFTVGVNYLCRFFEINVSYCMNLKNLDLEGAAIKYNRLCNIISELLLLERLRLRNCDTGEKLKISCASLKRLEICHCYGLVELKVDSPNLSHFTYDGDMINVCSNALVLSTIDLYFFSRKTGKEWFVKFAELLAEFHGCSDTLSLRDFKEEVFVVSKELRETIPFPLFSCQHLKIRLINLSLSFSIAKVVDDLLSIAPHPKTLSIELCYSRADCRKTAFQFSYKKPIVYEGEYASCCKSLPILCWQHCIDKVKVEVSHSCERVYCLKGATFLEKIDSLCGPIYD